jgi:hypothetical protein
MNNGKEVAKLKTLYQEGNREIILVTLHLAGISDQVIDFISDGLWSERQALIGADLSDKHEKEDKLGQLSFLDSEEKQDYQIEPKTTVRLGTRSAEIPLRKRNKAAIKKLKEILPQLEGKDILVSQYCDYWWYDDLRLKRLQVQWFDDSAFVLWGTKAQVRVLHLKFLYQVREQYYNNGKPYYLLDFWNGFRSSPLDSYHRGGYQCFQIRQAR